VTDVLTIVGSPSANSRSAAVLEQLGETLAGQGLRTRALNVRDLPPEDLIYGRVESPAVLEWAAQLRQARAVLIATPIYKASFSGVLKSFLDLLPQQALAGKLVLPIATGGTPLHALAIDYALRPVLVALGAQHILSGVYILDTQIQIGPDGVQLDAAIAQRLDGALQLLLDALVSRDARERGHGKPALARTPVQA
jgi:FMN reductase